ncbi:HAMP domain-containing sensor histidine kinase [Streptomyces sp. H10-C2]|uniref:sensor histidine kinase n=1 Tax=unclassified Streptomyces TaxID=2593676 RepID=UPI0024BA0458|nr:MULTISPECIES: HAMP domain-containing sensor histidine kinase [unclassified Streptomyces]MDJ0340525.1 HAMP domain-containing sensor histidine kinase [Streptomyces sp. PH10-H1]MDJ0370173.1 HAMP domain-containing sensor histidine kinase [Streptomyces sp. H10-C2]
MRREGKKACFWPRPQSLRGRFTIANVTFLAIGLVLAGCASLIGMYTMLIGEIDDSLKTSQKALAATPFTSGGVRQLCTVAGILQASSGGKVVAQVFEQDLFLVLDDRGRISTVCGGDVANLGEERRSLATALPDPKALAASGGAATVQSDGSYYRVVVSRLNDGTMVVKGMRLNGVRRAVGHLFIVEVVVGVVLLALLAMGSLTAARRRLQPLEDMVETASAISEGDLSRRIATASHGSTEVEQLSSALNAMLQQIETALTSSERATAQLRQFLADASHELRTPLACVRGYLQLYEKGMLDPDEKDRALRRVSAEAVRMSRLVDELLALARLEDRPALAPRPVDLSQLVRDGVADLAMQQPQRPIALVVPDGVEVLGDEPQLRQIIGNLLSNIRVHTPADSPVTLEVASQDQDVLLRITDSGPGLTPQDAARAFDRFFRADPDRARDTGGAGLGMSIVQAAVDAHHGSVRLDTTPGTGLTVRVTLPSALSSPPGA